MVTTPSVWKAETPANTSDAGKAQTNSSTVALKDGGYFVCWEDDSRIYDPSSLVIVGQRYDVLGEKVGGEVVVSPGVADATRPEATLLGNGTLAVVFGSSGDQHVAVSDAALTSFTPHPVETDDSSFTTGARIAKLANGTAVVLYSESNNIQGHILNGATIGSPFDLFADATNAAVAGLADGNFVVVAQTSASDIRFTIRDVLGEEVIGSTHVNGGKGAEYEGSPVVAALSGGGFAVAFFDTETGQDIGAAVYSPGGILVKGGIIANTTDGAQNPSIVGLADGGFLVAWFAGSTQIKAQRFNSAGQSVGSEFTMGEPTSFFPIDLALMNDGRVALTYTTTADGELDVATSIWDPRGTEILGTAAGEALTSRRDGATVRGLRGDDTLHGFEGADALDGGKGADQMIGRAGNDTYLVDEAGDVVDEAGGSGSDKVVSSISFSLAPSADVLGEVENLKLIGSAVAGSGNAGANVITGNAQGNWLEGGGGSDELLGRSGKDKLFGGDDGDILTGGRGADRMYAGQDGAKDVFVFRSLQDSGTLSGARDRIFDFDRKNASSEIISDKIDLHALGVKWSNVDIDTGGSHAKVSIDTDGDSAPEMVIQVMNIGDLNKADFIL